MADKRISDLPIVSSIDTGDVLAIDGASTRSIEVMDLPVTTATQTALSGKLAPSDIGVSVQAHSGNLDNFSGKVAPAGVVVGTTDAQTLTNKTITSPSGLVKADVGLGNVDNTSDVNKPVSTATQTALNLKANTSSLGTAAALNVGTSANNVVQLDGSAKLPAVDGSQLTGLPGGGDMLAANNLSDVASIQKAYANLGHTNVNTSGSPSGASPRIPSYADISRIFFGQEFLGAWQTAWQSGAIGNPTILLAGDSTMLGQNSGTAEYQPQNLFMAYARQKGLVFTATNVAVGSTTSTDWVNTQLPAHMSTYTGGNIPKLYIVNHGMNDAGGVANTITNLRNGFSTMRGGTWNADAVSVVYMMPNTASDDPNSRNEQWREDNVKAIKQACRDYGVCFFDTYAALREARAFITTGWLDSNHVHPNNLHYSSIWGLVTDVLCPPEVVYEASKPRKVTAASGFSLPSSSEDMSTILVGDIGNGFGYLNNTSGVTIPGGTTIGQVHTYHRPGLPTLAINVASWDGSAFTAFRARIDGSGNITTMEASGAAAARVYLGGSCWRR